MALLAGLLKLPNNIIFSLSLSTTNSSFFDASKSNFHELPARWVTSHMQIHRRGFAVVNSAEIQQEPKKKRRLDETCVERFQEYSRTFIQSWILQGHKLEAAIEEFGIDVSGKVALDSGLSTGGFTDCLLRYGASCVYGVDVGYGQVAEKIRRDERVSVIERTNLRYLSELPQKVIEKIIKGVENFGFTSKGWIESPIEGPEGNTEFLAYFVRTAEQSAE